MGKEVLFTNEIRCSKMTTEKILCKESKEETGESVILYTILSDIEKTLRRSMHNRIRIEKTKDT